MASVALQALVGPNTDYPFYKENEKFHPKETAEGALFCSEVEMYNPTPEQEKIDRQKAYETGVPHGYRRVHTATISIFFFHLHSLISCAPPWK